MEIFSQSRRRVQRGAAPVGGHDDQHKDRYQIGGHRQVLYRNARPRRLEIKLKDSNSAEKIGAK
jgi:hypothetical protein